ncbi:uncharacterized protein LOC130310103 isoform X2 [Hyla sarda]|uniref:uncharacterized protein LOC130310103 isoform X2 n=1 Tax=Hyla sarda TaxID=327740 RepID=UPI0024C2A08A|nr:uncharacterized protein LOC130310103 isoform X2 [Hyla sarda]
MPSCIVSGCIHKTTKKNCNEEGVIMHAFPSSLSRIKLWLRSIERNNHQYFGDIDALAENIFYKKNNSSSRICSDHFDSECYVPAHSKRRALRQDAVPTLFRAPLALTAIHDATPPQHIPFMVDAITQTDPYTYTQDKVNLHWQQERLRLNKASLGTRLCLAGSGQCNTYENGYRYGIYTFLDTATKRIVDFETIQGTKANSFVALKRKAFVRCLNRILRDRFEVASVSTDYHPKLKKTCEQQYRIQHEYDAWLYTKGIEKRLLAACRKENCSVIAEWIPSIKKHLWWCLGASNGDAKVLCELWQSVLMHVTDRHKWDHGELYHACAHRPLTEFERHCRPWVKENSEPYHALYDVVMNPKVLKDLHHLSRFLHTGEIDVYHHFLSKYRRKRVYLKLNALEARIKLAALAHNANVHRKRVNFHSIWHGKAAIGTRRHDGISRKKKYNSKTLSGSSNSHVLPMMTDVLKFFDCRLTNDCSLWTSALKDITEQTLNKRSY